MGESRVHTVHLGDLAVVALVEGGVREITLLGQNVNAWGGEDDKGKVCAVSV